MSANIQLSPKHRTWVLVSCILQQFAFLCISFGYGLGLPQIVAGFNKSEYYALVGVVYSLTQGGAAGATKFMVQMIQETGFEKNKMGYASAMTMALFVILALFTVIQFKLNQGGEQDAD